jgi:hypothetical protein
LKNEFGSWNRDKGIDAKVVFQPSYAWRSLMSAKEVIEAGARWEIDNGRNIKNTSG